MEIELGKTNKSRGREVVLQMIIISQQSRRTKMETKMKSKSGAVLLIFQVFSIPKTSRRLKPFIDHILLFSILDNKIWFRNYQIIEKDPLPAPPSSTPSSTSTKPAYKGAPQNTLIEIGPRFVLTPIKIFEGSFSGPTLYSNPEFVTPAAIRRNLKYQKGESYRVRVEKEDQRDNREKRRREELPEDQLARKKVFA